MYKTTVIRNARIVSDGAVREADVFLRNGRIEKISEQIAESGDLELDIRGKFLIPGVIDDQVHFREPGLTHKANIATESRAAVAGGTTSFMEMPNVNPPSVTQELLEAKYAIGAASSLANYSFFMGGTNDNYDEVMRTNTETVCGIKLFMGSSTGNMLVDDTQVLDRLFANAPMLIATHCEDEQTVRKNMADFESRFGDTLHARNHPEIRSVEACYLSSSKAIGLAKKHGTRLHILHISTEEELALFDNTLPLSEKRITSEVCVHHLYFSADDYETLGNLIKCNPAIKESRHKEALFKALLDDRLDIIATDHAPHTWEEKSQPYSQAPSGLPLVQHALNLMLDFHQKGMITMERIVEKMCHAPAITFQLRERGFIREGYWADLVVVDPDKTWTVSKDNIQYKCGWSPLEGKTFKGAVESTFVSGHLAWHEGKFNEAQMGQRLMFDRSN
ncbi:MAG: dihydroorotase [Saprospiraceae bacterium]